MQGGPQYRPPPPPPPPDDDEDVAEEHGRPRCYFCGQQFGREADIQKAQHNIGNNYHKFVFICSRCRSKGMAKTGCLVWIITGGMLLAGAAAFAAG